VSALLGALLRPPRAEPELAYVRLRIAGQTGVRVHLLLPPGEEDRAADAAADAALRGAVTAEIRARSLPSLGALGDAAFADLVVRLARIVEVRSPGGGSSTLPASVLRAADQAGLGRVLGEGPDATRARWVALGGSGDPAAINQLWTDCEAQLAELVEVVAKAVSVYQAGTGRPFSRDDLPSPDLAAAIAAVAGTSAPGRVWISESAALAVGRA
jgi:hypothetical protein